MAHVFHVILFRKTYFSDGRTCLPHSHRRTHLVQGQRTQGLAGVVRKGRKLHGCAVAVGLDQRLACIRNVGKGLFKGPILLGYDHQQASTRIPWVPQGAQQRVLTSLVAHMYSCNPRSSPSSHSSTHRCHSQMAPHRRMSYGPPRRTQQGQAVAWIEARRDHCCPEATPGTRQLGRPRIHSTMGGTSLDQQVTASKAKCKKGVRMCSTMGKGSTDVESLGRGGTPRPRPQVAIPSGGSLLKDGGRGNGKGMPRYLTSSYTSSNAPESRRPRRVGSPRGGARGGQRGRHLRGDQRTPRWGAP